MKTTIVLTVLIFVAPSVHASAEHDPHHDQTVEEIEGLKTRIKALRDITDKINRNVCQSGNSVTVLCDRFDDVQSSVKCVTAPLTSPLTKKSTVDISRTFETLPVFAVGVTGLSLALGGDLEVSAQEAQKNKFKLQVSSDHLIAPFTVSSGFFGCPSKLEFGP